MPTTRGILGLVDEVIQLHKTVSEFGHVALICALWLSLVHNR